MQITKRKYASLALFISALNRLKTKGYSSYGHDVIRNDDGVPYEIVLYYARMAMNPVGYILGDEHYECRIPIVPARTIERNQMIEQDFPFHKYLVDLGAEWHLECTDAPDSEVCDDPDHDSEGECDCEFYCSPKDDWSFYEDFVFGEFDHMIELTLKVDVSFTFDGGKWHVSF